MRSVMIYVILLFLPLAVIAKPIQLTHETSDELLIEFTLPEWEFEQKTERNANWHKIQTDFGTIRNQEGYPEVYTFSEAIGIPVDGDISFQILDMKTTTHKEINLLPIRRMLVTRDAVDYEFYQNNLAYQNENFYPQNPVEKGEAAFIGDRRFVSFRINPFRYKAAARELQVIKSLKLRIVISGNKASAKNWQLAENPIDAAADEFFLNNNTSKTWRMEKVRDHSYSAPKNGSGQIHEIQLIVDKEGIYKVTKGFLQGHIASQQALLGQNLAWSLNSIDPRNLELRDKNGQVPIHFVGESDGSFDDGDYFEFYGDRNYGKSGYSDAYTAENVYTLSLNAGLGARMAVENGGLINSNPAQYKMPTAYEYTTHLEEQLIIDKLGRGWSAQNLNFYKEDIWFWRKISAPNLDIVPFNLEYPKDSAINHFQAIIALYGLTYSDPVPPSGQYDHSAEVRLNQAMINMHSWVGQTEKIFENANPMPNSYLRHGENHLYISLPGNTVMGDREQVLLDYATITYWREYKTSTDDILFAKPPLSSQYPYGLYQFEVSGFSDSNVSLYKIGSSVFNSMQIEPFNLEGTAPWTVTFQDSVASADVKYYAVTEAKKMQPKQVRLNIVSDLQNPSNAADVILVTVREFVECNATQQLVDLWEARGYTLKVVDVQDIYDEFNNGIRAAEPIRDFFRYAYNNWSNPQLKHVILMGEGTDDERDFSTNRPYNLIPVKKLWTFKHGATASDNWYACIVGNDFVADVSVARINIWAETQIENFAQKVAQYNNNPLPNRLWSSHITLASGGKITDTDDKFAQQSERIRRKAIPNHYRVSRVYTSTQTVSPDYFGGTFSLKDAINSGSQFVQFMGHGGGRIWADYNLFNFNDVATLNNQAYPFVISLACYCSAFDTRGAASISEALINQANKGSIATLGFTGLGYEYDDEDYGLALNEALFKHDFDSLGEAIIFTKARFFTTCASVAATPALINGSAFLGDPLAKLRKPVAGIPVSVEKNVLQPGDTLRVTGQFPAGVTAARLFVMKTNEKVVNVPYDLPVVQNTFNASYVIPADQGTNYTRKLYVAGYSQDTEYIGMGQVGIGLANVMHHALNPVKPTWADSVSFSARVYLQNPVNSLICRVRVDTLLTTGVWVTLPMERVNESDSTLYVTTQKAPRTKTGKEVLYKYVLTDSIRTYESPEYSYVTSGPDLFLKDIRMVQTNEGLAIETLCENIGDAASVTTDLRLNVTPENQSTYLFKTQDLAPYDVYEKRWERVTLEGLDNANVTFQVKVNSSGTFSEWHLYQNTNNEITMQVPFNYHFVGSGGSQINSLDTNLSCNIPPNLVPDGASSLFYIHTLDTLSPNSQPDISALMLRSGTMSVPYEIRTLDSSLADSTGTFLNNKKLTLTYYYHLTDPQTQQYESENSYKIYRWEDSCRKWIHQGGIISTSENKVVFEVGRQGIYTLYRNTDHVRPSIDVNVQDQEFTVGGYISGKGTISLLLSDTNGIDVFDNSIRMYLSDGLSINEIPGESFVKTVNADNINRIPIKYQLNLSKGNYTLIVDCKDVNGNFNSRDVQFTVNDKFDVQRLANYPNPVLGRAEDPKNDGRTRFTYVLTDDADEVTIKIYTISGRLVNTFRNLPTGVGYHEYPRTVYGWDCKDGQGFYLANGTYFYKIIARKGSKKIEKIQKMAIVK